MTHDMDQIGAKVAVLRDRVQQLIPSRRLSAPALRRERREAEANDKEPVSYWRLWGWTAFTGTAILLLLFGGYEVVERAFLAEASPTLIYVLHIMRGMGSAMVLGTWAFWVATRTRRHYAAKLTENIQRLEQEVLQRTVELERSQAFTEHLFDTLRDRIVVTDAEGQVVKVNRVARESIMPNPACRTQCSAAECAQDCRFDGHESGFHRDPATGRLFEVERYPVPGQEGDPELVLEVARDVTDAKRLEAIVVHQEKMASLGVLAAGIAHDIGNPLASLSSELEMLELEDDPSQFHESLGLLREHVDRIGRALREMVDFARRRGEDEAADVSVATVIDDALRLVRHDKRMRRVELVTDVDSELPAVRIVEDHLVLVLVNLVLNALDAMPDGGRLTVSAQPLGSEVRVSVCDTGVGMPEEVVRRAFDALFTTKSERSGTGLGLSVSQSVVRAAGGRLEIRSEPGRGTEVFLTLVSGGEDG